MSIKHMIQHTSMVYCTSYGSTTVSMAMLGGGAMNSYMGDESESSMDRQEQTGVTPQLESHRVV